MRDAFLLTDSLSLSSLLERIPDFELVEELGSNVYQCGSDATFIEIEQDDSILQYYEDSELEALNSLGADIDSLRLLALTYRNPQALMSKLVRLRAMPRMWFDNDHGLVMPLNAFLDRVVGNPNWDWSTSIE